MTSSIATTASTVSGETPAGGTPPGTLAGNTAGTPDGGTGLPPGASARSLRPEPPSAGPTAACCTAC
ncbi:hypothetical protein FCN77_02570 [Arthrobacter sp. 24S4-2]|uniref:hypothetical protein n=1 Tax=Arthrobacter sp. 24S4-2 TaxID=2575374 RepID=UPI0010C783DD|nr:hypothetical protein [Arthrobacter sp. 24S4-2]QCO96800.1 hypothetical protein FCN77_02570 [Arthrobacter sp. 24S4-2]